MHIQKSSALLAISVMLVAMPALASSEALPAQAVSHMPVCPPANQPESARCHAHVITDRNNQPQTTTGPTGYGPRQFTAAYNPAGITGTANKVIAIVDAYDSPTVYTDLQSYSSQFGLTQLANCTVSSSSSSTQPCFQKLSQRGDVSYPAVNGGWALEIALDVQAAHALCPDCSILLVEADSNSFTNLLTAEDLAVSKGAVVVSNSWGGSEFSGERNYDFHFSHPGTAFTVSSGDNGFGTEYPAASSNVTAVGGTNLKITANLDGTYSYGGESAWSGSGSGCSSYELKPSFQTDTGCSRRMVADVSADADPNTGASVYDTTPDNGQTGWFQVGGTSLASPLIAAMYALGGVSAGAQANALPYQNSTMLHDVVSGSNGRCKRMPAYFCNGVTGYDGPTGLGTPNGIGAF